MRTIKPTALTALNAPFQHDGKIRLLLIVGAMVSLDGRVIEQEQTLWKLMAGLPGSRGFIDELKPKVRGEALVSGYAFTPMGKPEPIVAARLEVGPIQKEVWAIGDRFWKMAGPTEALPFEKMPLTYDRAFGGPGFEANPIGKGHAAFKGENGETVHPLPNLEVAKKLVRSAGDRPPVAGFSPIEPSLPFRMKKLGTYDQKWFETRYPEMAKDFDPTYFNIAPEDQWIPGFWQGGEPFLLQNMHPEKRKLEGTVPSFRPRALVTRRGAEDGVIEDVALRCDTLWFLPHEERVILLYRGGIDVVDEEASDVLDVIVGLERPTEPRPVEHYVEVRRKRLDKDRGALHALNDLDLVPSDLPIARSKAFADTDELLQTEGLKQANIRRRAARELDDARAKLAARGIDPDKHFPKELPPEPKPISGGDVKALEEMRAKAEEARRESEVKRAEALTVLRDSLKKFGVDPDKALAKNAVGGPPKFSADGTLGELRALAARAKAKGRPVPAVAAQLDDPGLVEKLRRGETATRDAYRRTAHHQAPASVLGGPESAALRAQIEAALVAKESLADRDLTGADLSGLDFSGCDLRRTFLEKAKLVGCAFRGANVTNVVFTRADLTDADLDDAVASGANFGHANLTRVKLRRADLTEAVLMNALVREADLTGAKLDRTKITDAKLDRANLSGIHAKELAVFTGDFRGVNLAGARLETCTFSNVDFSGGDFTDASFFRVSLVDVTIEDARLRGVKLERVSFSKVEKGSSLARSDLRGADLRRINFRGVDFQGADLREADLRDADFSKADMRGAKLEAARAAHARFMGSDLTGADLSRVDLLGARMGSSTVNGANFEEANLFRADADRMRGDNDTSFKGANLKQVRVTPATTAKPRPASAPTPASPATPPTTERK